MIRIKLAKETDIEVVALLGRLTWAESHGHYIDDKNNLLKPVVHYDLKGKSCSLY